MQLFELKEKFKECVDKIEKGWGSYKKLAIVKRTAEVKKKRVKEATEVWQSLCRTTTAIEVLLDDEDEDPCFVAEKESIKKIYKDYIAALVKDQMAPRNSSPFIKTTTTIEESGSARASGTNGNDGENNGEYENENDDDDDSQMDEDIKIFLKQQTIRYDTIKRIIKDVQEKQSRNQDITVAYCRMKLKRITESWQRMQVADEECSLDRDNFPGEYHSVLEDLEIELEEVLLFLQEKLEKPIANNQNDAVKLPRVTISKFSGDYFKWTTFRDLFTTMVVDNKTLSDGQRMQLLKSYTEGEAENLIRDLTIADVNFASAWERITTRYNNRRVVVYKHLAKLMDQKTIQTESRAVKKLLDVTDQTLLALKNLERPVESWDDWIIIIVTQKLSDEVRKDWEKKIGSSSNLPTWEQLKEFLEEEFRMLEGVENGHKNRSQGSKATESQKSNGLIKVYQTSVGKYPCPACAEEHGLFQCAKFKSMKVTERFELAKGNKLCFKCLKKHKDVLRCDKKKPCKKCDKNHSTWLHENKNTEEITNAMGIIKNENITTAVAAVYKNEKQVLLATALIATTDLWGRRIVLRALIDQGSQGSMITDKAAHMLQLQQIPTSRYVSSLGGNNSGRINQVNMVIKPRFNSDIRISIECYILKKLTKILPDSNLNVDNWEHLKGLQLADPTYHKMGQIDLLLGTDVVSEILKAGFIRGTKGTPMAQETSFGWIVSGNVDPHYPNKTIKCLISTSNDCGEDISRFWELEELNPKRTLTSDERECEEFYQRTHWRDENGIFTVKVPFKEGSDGPHRLGLSKGQAMARFIQLEKRFLKDKNLQTEYIKVMQEYITLGHMIEVLNNPPLYYIPHHPVIKSDSLTTKTRVVFDASAKTSTGVSLNQCMHTGAKQQNDLYETLIKWRKHKIVFKADVEKMYRMMRLDKEDQRYHTILWRSSPDEEIKEYQLTTPTFGTAAAPFMATRSLVQIATDVKDKYPLASQIINEDFYVDDLMSGSSDIEGALHAKDEIIAALKEGGLNLRKWSSNDTRLLDSLPADLTEKSLQTFSDDETTKALGIQWNPTTDKFGFSITWEPKGEIITKRILFSEAAKLFDPLGWLAPTVIVAKILMQEVWESKIDWDDEVSAVTKEKWIQFRKELPDIGNISIDRWINYEGECKIQIHGFCDASEKGYSAVIYTRIQRGTNIEISLITSKTRVAPVKTKITIPRLELCSAVLLANLLERVRGALGLENAPMIAWSDSMISLGWLKGDPNKWVTFVANRVAEVQNTRVRDWRHVISEDNPADCASRGLMPGELKDFELWWNGPKWLKQDPTSWPKAEIPEAENDRRKIAVNAAAIERTELLLEGSSWFKMVRILAYVLRMKGKRSSGPLLTVEEINYAKNVIYKKCQRECFHEEIQQLENNEPLSNKSKLLQLNPFIDKDGILRVGGRLQNAIISFDNKHPIILPSGHQISKMIIHQIHLDTLHGGPQIMTGLLRKKYWIIQGKRMANEEFKHCLNCRRMVGRTNNQIMGNLPRERVTLERAFLFTGLDYAGPVDIRASRLKKAKVLKAYIAVFVCFGTKAIHLELVSDMTTAAFMAALQRFIARRGLCQTIYSDNGRNFVGTMNQLERQEKQWLHSKNEELASLIINKGIGWKFIPPGSPHFGGLWERGVRSVKEHLKRTLKNSRLTFEEYNTVLCQIEACLNSRPLCPLTNNLDNLNALTPGHFLIGDSLMAIPQQSLLDIRANHVDRWKYLQLLQQHFWNRWNNEYLNQLQKRHKWQNEQIPVNQGDLVLVKDEQLPPRHWLLGRVTEVYPGKDSKIRVVSLKTQKGELKRPFCKICPLLTNDELINGNVWNNSTQPTEEAENGNVISTPPTEETEDGNVEEEKIDHEIEKHDLGPDVKEYKLDETVEKEPVTKPSSHHKYGLRSKMSNSSLVMLALLGFIIFLGGGLAADGVKITQFEQYAGIYFEDMGRASVIRTDWHMYLRFDMARYMNDCNQAQQISTSLTNLCEANSSISTRSQCEDLTAILSHKLTKIQELNGLLTEHGNGQATRTRRAAPLNIVGWAAHEIFGVMAADQAEHIENNFEQVKVNSKHLLKLLQNQTSIVESTVNLMRVSQEESTRNFQKIQDAINALAHEGSYMKIRLKTMALSIIAMVYVNRLEKTQSDLLDIITDLHQGHINSQLFTPSQFAQQLEIINSNLPVGSIVPKMGRDDLKPLYKVLKGSARVTNNSIIVDIILPLVSSVALQVLHVIPIPTEYQGQYITVVPETDYMMMTLKRDSFYQVSEKEFHTCMQPRAKMFMCSLRQPLYNHQSEKSLCEREMLAQTTDVSSQCKFNVTPKKDFWISLESKNQWIFGIINKVTVNIICENQAQSIILQGSGTLELQAGCEVSQTQMTLTAESVKSSNGNFNVYPSLNLIESVVKADAAHEINLVDLTINSGNELKDLKQRVNELKQQTHFHKIHNYVSHSSLGLIVMVIIALAAGCWFKRRIIKSKINEWYVSPEQNDGVDIRHDGEVGHELRASQTISSADSDDHNVHSTVARHRAGECPFRT